MTAIKKGQWSLVTITALMRATNFLSWSVPLVVLVIVGCETESADPVGQDTTAVTRNDQLFIYQGAYDSLGTVDSIAQLAARHGYVVVTHGFFLDGSLWTHGRCLDVNYTRMPELLVKIRAHNSSVKIFAYVPATADHPNGCWPIPSVQMVECPDGSCGDFRTWTNLWLNLERDYPGISIDGIFIDLVHPALIGSAVRDSVFAYVKSRGKAVMANALSDTIGLAFATSSVFFGSNDIVLLEGYSLIAGYPNSQTDGMNRYVRARNIRWAALVTETYNAPVTCGSENMRRGYESFRQYGGTAFTYQSADLGTQSNTWIYCPPGAK